jgi:hypothetical protein
VINPEDAQVLQRNKRAPKNAIKLVSTRKQVRQINDEAILALPTTQPTHTYSCYDHFDKRNNLGSILMFGGLPDTTSGRSVSSNHTPFHQCACLSFSQKDHSYEAEVCLKVGIRVVLRQNLEPDRGLVNGSQGKVINFKACDIKQLSGNTQGYSEDGHGAPRLGGNDAAYHYANIKKFAERNRYRPWPVVRFDNEEVRTTYADFAMGECGDSEPYNVNFRTQTPLIAGYAMTIHVAQVSPLLRDTRGSPMH